MGASSRRVAVFARCGGRCHYCGDPATTLDHIVPKSDGGPSAQWNLTAACQPCNLIKGSWRAVCPCFSCIAAEKHFEGMAPRVLPRPRKKPKRPKSVPSPLVIEWPGSAPKGHPLSAWRVSQEEALMARRAVCNHVRAASGMAAYCAKCGLDLDRVVS